MNLIKNTANPLFKRKEVIFGVESDTHPTFADAKKNIAEQLKAREETIDVYAVEGSFGKKHRTIRAYVYDSKEDLDKGVQLTQKKRKEIAQKEKEEAEKAAKEAEQPHEETPSESIEKTASDTGEKPISAEMPTEPIKENSTE